jgi:hypothetical protein
MIGLFRDQSYSSEAKEIEPPNCATEPFYFPLFRFECSETALVLSKQYIPLKDE